MLERDLVEQVTQYLIWNKITYRFDLAADMKMTIGQAVRNKKINGDKGFPDLCIFLRGGKTIFIELKKSKDEIYKKDGNFKKNKHLQEQLEYHEKLRHLGFSVYFAFNINDIENILQKEEK